MNAKKFSTASLSKILAFLAICFVQGAFADNAATIASYITATSGGGLSATYSGATVTVTGSIGAVPSTSDYLTLNIDAGVTVVWRASLSGGTSSNYDLVYINGGSGTFRVESGGRIENTGDGTAIRNNTSGSVTVSGGIVLAGGDVIYNYSGTVTVSSGTISSTNEPVLYNSCAICNHSGSVTVSGGAISSKGFAILNYGTATISGGTVSTTNATAIYNTNSGTVTISGNSEITSASSEGTIELWSGVLNVNGGTVKNTGTGSAISNDGFSSTVTVSGGIISATAGYGIFNSRPLTINGGTVSSISGEAIYNYGTVTINNGTIKSTNRRAIYSYHSSVTITGGTISSSNDSISIYFECPESYTASLVLGGSPSITGRIYSYPEKLIVLTTGTNTFAPGQKVYKLDFPTAQYVASKIAVMDGGNFLSNFQLYNSSWALRKEGLHLAVVSAIKVSFNLSGGSGKAPDSIGVASGNTLSITQKPATTGFARNGYTNDGKWYTNAAGTTEFIFGTTPVTNNTTLYLNWNLITYAITYNLNDGVQNTQNPNNYTVLSDTIKLQAAIKTDYYFAGWYTSNSFIGTPVTSIPKGSTGDKTYWARWVVPYNVIYHLSGGTQNLQNPSTYYSENAWTLYAPAKTGYTFGGWYDNDDFTGSAITSIPIGSMGDKEFYAKWTPIVYVISYTLNSGTNSVKNPTTYTIADSVVLGEPTREGYVFGGWYYNSEFTGDSVVSIPAGSTIGNKSFYAKWTAINYGITYHFDGGMQNASNYSTYTITSSRMLYNPTRTGYIFAGWYDNTEFTGSAITSIPIGSTGNKEFYAKWIPISYTIIYNLDEGVNFAENPETYTIADSVVFDEPTREGYVFGGWYDNAGFTGDSVTSIPLGNTGNKTLYAKWATINYDITYHLDGGMQNALNPTTYTVERTYSMSEDFNRSGWTTANSGWTLSRFSRNSTSGVSGTAGLRVNLYSSIPTGYAQTPNINLGNNSVISLNYKVVNYSGGAATSASNFGMNIQVSTNNGSTWNTVSTLSHTASTSYKKWQVDLAGYANQSVLVRIVGQYNSGDFYIDIDDVVVNNVLLPPTKIGYTFDGWYDNAYFTGSAIVSIPAGNVGSKVLYAKWIPTIYSIVYYLDGGTNSAENPDTYTIDNSVIFNEPARIGYIFAGWYDNAGFTGDSVTSIPLGNTGDKTLYAKWTAINYDITYHLDGGMQNVLNPTTYTVERTYSMSEDFNRSDWTSANSGWTLYNFSINLTSGVDDTSNLRANLWGSFPIGYVQTPNINLGNNSIISLNYKVVNYSGGAATPASNFGMSIQVSTDNGSTWNTVSTLSHTASTAYQKWQVNLAGYANQSVLVRIIASRNSGDFYVYIDDVAVESGLLLLSPTKIGYAFGGWYDNAGFTGDSITSIPLGSTGNKYFYAKWTPIPYTIAYTLNGGTNSAENPATYTIVDSVMLYEPTREGYAFGGWYDNAEFTGSAITSIPIGSTGDKNFYAKWTLESTPTIKSFAAQNAVILISGENFSIQGLTKTETVRIFNLKGRAVMNREIAPNESVSISHLSKGAYIVNVGGKSFKLVR